MTNIIRHSSIPSTGSGPSENIWGAGQFPGLEVQDDPGLATYDFDDFIDTNKTLTVASNLGRYARGWKSYEATGTFFGNFSAAGDAAGMVRLTGITTADLGVTIQKGMESVNSNGAGAYQITTSYGPKLWFETRIRRSDTFGANLADMFIGLAGKDIAVVNGIVSSGSFAAINSLGFYAAAATGTALKAQYQASGGSGIKSPFIVGSTSSTTVQTLVSATWYKLGIIVDGGSPLIDPVTGNQKIIRYFVNGQEVAFNTSGTYDATKNPNGITGSDFPSAVGLGPTFGIQSKTSTGATNLPALDIDWVRIAQIRA